jgi:hypothetical protein
VNYTTRLILTAAAIVVGVAGGLVANYQRSFHNVAITIDPGLQVAVYKDLGGDGAYNYNANSTPLASLNGDQTIKLRDGIYDAVVSDPNHQYENPVIKVVVTAGTNSATISPTYTTARLAALLASQQAAITQALDAKYPSLPSLYTVSGQLYEHADWYGAVLEPNNPANDILRVILHKQGSTWAVVTDPPEISIGEPSNLSIPTDVIESVDQLGSGS